MAYMTCTRRKAAAGPAIQEGLSSELYAGLCDLHRREESHARCYFATYLELRVLHLGQINNAVRTWTA